MRESHKHNVLLLFSLAIILGTAGLYASLLYGWLRRPQSSGVSAPARSNDALQTARQDFRDRFLYPEAWLRLSQALFANGRPIDSFYVMEGARQFFGDDAFRRAHEDVVLKREPGLETTGEDDEASLRRRLQDDPNDPPVIVALADIEFRSGRVAEAQSLLDTSLGAHPSDRALLFEKALQTLDPMQSIPFYAQAVHAGPKTYEGIKSLEALKVIASEPDDGPRGEAASLAREALQELLKAHPKEPSILDALGLALLNSGHRSTAQALAQEAAHKGDATGAAVLDGALALKDNDVDFAIRRLTAAWEADPGNAYASEKLAEIYDLQRGEPEAALPYYIALYRLEPFREEGAEPLEHVIRRILDARRQQLLADVPASGLGHFLNSDDASLRAEACVRAAVLKDPRWIDVLAGLLDDDTEIVRHNADYALYQLAKIYPDAILVRRDDWLARSGFLERARVLNLFADLWPKTTWPLVQKALYSQNPALRYLVKTMILDNYYRGDAAVAKAKADYLSQENDPRVLALFKRDQMLESQSRRR
ncbi:MAG: hypothetical protein KGK30_07170 [Elusimicrobia bacterium]|nr:hypothetical protein [Elusimicrobiota bacterium]